METIKEFKYKLIKNFLTKEEIQLCKNYSIIKHRLEDDPIMDSQGTDSSHYADHLTEALLLSKKEKMEECVGLKLLPTYSYYRVYTFAGELKEHIDRDSCEISVTIHIDSSGEEWPISIEGNKYNLNPGDAVVYLGCDLKHGRETFKGDYYIQCFLHYVDRNGNKTMFYKDMRDLWGEKNSKKLTNYYNNKNENNT